MRYFTFFIATRLVSCVTKNIIVVGRTGVGKSSLINSLRGSDEALVAHDSTGTTSVNAYELNGLSEEVSFLIWDTPGLFDPLIEGGVVSTLRDIQESVSTVSAVVLAIDIYDPRMGQKAEDVNTLRLLFSAFGEELWERVIVVLTHANLLEPADIDFKVNYMIGLLGERVAAEIIPEVPPVIAVGRETGGMGIRPHGWHIRLLKQIEHFARNQEVEVVLDVSRISACSLTDSHNIVDFMIRESRELNKKFEEMEEHVKELLAERLANEERLRQVTEEDGLEGEAGEEGKENDASRVTKEDLIRGARDLRFRLVIAEQDIRRLAVLSDNLEEKVRSDKVKHAIYWVGFSGASMLLGKYTGKLNFAGRVGQLLLAIKG